MASAELRTSETETAPPRGGGLGPIQCVVVTPERAVVDERVEFVALPLYDGELGVLPGRTPLIARLGHGELRTRDAKQHTRRYFVDSGFVQIRDNVVTVLTTRAMPASQLDPVIAEREMEQARALRPRTEEQFEEKARAVSRARAMQRLVVHRKD